MRFFAALDPNSDIARRWRGESRLSGLLDTVLFRWEGNRFASGELSYEEAQRFRARQDQAVRLEVIGVLPETMRQDSPSQQVVEDPEQQPAAQVEQQEVRPTRRSRLKIEE